MNECLSRWSGTQDNKTPSTLPTRGVQMSTWVGVLTQWGPQWPQGWSHLTESETEDMLYGIHSADLGQ